MNENDDSAPILQRLNIVGWTIGVHLTKESNKEINCSHLSFNEPVLDLFNSHGGKQPL